MTTIDCPKCKTNLVMFADNYVITHKKEENWLMVQCAKCKIMIGADGVIIN